MKKMLILILSSFVLCSCGSQEKATITKIDCEQKNLLLTQGATLIDVRSVQEYNLDHLDEAINIDYEQIESKIESEVPNKEDKIIVYCQSGKRSSTAASTLIDMGYTNVYDLGSINSCNE